MSDFDLVLIGDIVLPDRVIERGHVAVRDGRVAAVGDGPAPGAATVEDFTGGLILPGCDRRAGPFALPGRPRGFPLVDPLGGDRRGNDDCRHAL